MAEGVVQAGTVLGGDFEIVELIASGGMGAVYLAKQRSTGALRAVKTMHLHLSTDDDFRRRFAQEATIGTHIRSEHVVQVLAAGIDEATNVPWIAMEHLRGEHVERYVERKGRLSLVELVELFSQLCHALAAAHRADIVHRDLKPENVFVSPSQRVGEPYSVKILDFGIAKIRKAGETQAKSTSALGTPLWMAPEQLRMGGDIDARADVWALGLIAFYCLTGKYYWRAAEAEDIDLAELVTEIAFKPLPNVNVRTTELGVPGVPTAVRVWFERCVERDRDQRFPDAGAAFDALVVAAKTVENFMTSASPAALTELSVGRTVPTDQLNAVYTERSTTAPGEKTTLPKSLLLAGLATVAGLCLFGLSKLSPEHEAPVAETIPDTPVKPAHFVDMVPAATVAGGAMKQGRSGGPADEAPAHGVTVASYRLDVHEVTVSAYEACVASGECSTAGQGDECNSGRSDRLNHPINCVDFAQASAYCAAQGKELPTEEEWEFAARQGHNALFPWGARTPTSEDACFAQREGAEGTCEVGSHPAGRTPSGIDDLAGNVWEWTDSAFCSYAHPDCFDPRRVARGGSFASNGPDVVSTTVRVPFPPATRGATLGFRCAKTR